MIEYLSFQYCKEDGHSSTITVRLSGDHYILSTANGRNGVYVSDAFKTYKCPAGALSRACDNIKALKIYSWASNYPSDYKVRNRLMGVDSGTWNLDYKEVGKKRTRHINGCGAYPSEWTSFILSLATMSPSESVIYWIYHLT